MTTSLFQCWSHTRDVTCPAGNLSGNRPRERYPVSRLAVEWLPSRSPASRPRKAESVMMLGELNNTAHEVARATLADLFEAQVRRTPESPAVLFDGGEFSYADLEARTNRLAHALI